MHSDFENQFGEEPLPEECGWLHTYKKIATVVCCEASTNMVEACKKNGYQYIHVRTEQDALRAESEGLTPLLWTGKKWTKWRHVFMYKEFIIRQIALELAHSFTYDGGEAPYYADDFLEGLNSLTEDDLVPEVGELIDDLDFSEIASIEQAADYLAHGIASKKIEYPEDFERIIFRLEGFPH